MFSSCNRKEMYVSEFSAIYGFLLLNMYRTVLVHFHLQLEFGLFPFDIISNVAGCVDGQILGIELLDSFGHQCQKLPISVVIKI